MSVYIYTPVVVSAPITPPAHYHPPTKPQHQNTVKSLELEVQRLQRRASSRSVLLKRQGSSGSGSGSAAVASPPRVVKVRDVYFFVFVFVGGRAWPASDKRRRHRGCCYHQALDASFTSTFTYTTGRVHPAGGGADRGQQARGACIVHALL